MAHESFEDPDVAAAMNAHFVNIKVDREERPDLDQIYQTAHALLTRRSGGWPLTMFLTPDGAPFFGGTYFPKRRALRAARLPRSAAARGRGVSRAGRRRSPKQNAQLTRARWRALEPAPTRRRRSPAPRAGRRARGARSARSIPSTAASARAPKFPHATELEFCLRACGASGDAEALATSCGVTLARMADGGIHDQLGGGFCRYSVDAEWTIPHFEKMLYDNGPLLGALRGPRARRRGDARVRATSRAASSAG